MRCPKVVGLKQRLFWLHHDNIVAIADCGMPMEEARCPECGARIGGHNNHIPVQGVSRAEELEEIARGVGGLEFSTYPAVHSHFGDGESFVQKT